MEVVSFYDVCWYQFKSGSKNPITILTGPEINGVINNKIQESTPKENEKGATLLDPG